MITTEIDKYDNSCYNYDDVVNWYLNWIQDVEDSSLEEDKPTLVVQSINTIDPDVDLVNSLYDVNDINHGKKKLNVFSF